MKIKLSYRDVKADPNSIHRDQSETPENNPKDNKGLMKLKPKIDVNIQIDEERTNMGEEITMGLNARNLLNTVR